MDEPRPPVDIRAALDRVGDGIVTVDTDWVCTYVNAAAARMVGLDVDRLVGSHIWEQFPFLEGTNIEHHYREAMRTQQVTQFDRDLPAVGIVAEVRVFPAPDGMTIHLRDVTEERQLVAERARLLAEIRESHRARMLFEAVVERTPDFIGLAVVDGPIRYLNPAARALTALPPEQDETELVVRDFQTDEVRKVFEDERLPTLEKDGTPWVGPSELPRFDGGPPVPVRQSVFLIPGAAEDDPPTLATIQRDARPQLAFRDRLRSEAAARRDLLDRLVALQEEERTSIANDIHDDSVQTLAAMDLRLSVLARKVEQSAPQCLPLVADVQRSLGVATDTLRGLLRELETPSLGGALVDAIRDTVEQMLPRAQVAVGVHGAPDVDLPRAERVQAMRCLREAIRRCGARPEMTRLDVTVTDEDDGVGISISHDCHPSEEEVRRGDAALQAHAELIGGTVDCRAQPEGGYVIDFRFPRL